MRLKLPHDVTSAQVLGSLVLGLILNLFILIGKVWVVVIVLRGLGVISGGTP